MVIFKKCQTKAILERFNCQLYKQMFLSSPAMDNELPSFMYRKNKNRQFCTVLGGQTKWPLIARPAALALVRRLSTFD
jgi:hypothetical protein